MPMPKPPSSSGPNPPDGDPPVEGLSRVPIGEGPCAPHVDAGRLRRAGRAPAEALSSGERLTAGLAPPWRVGRGAPLRPRGPSPSRRPARRACPWWRSGRPSPARAGGCTAPRRPSPGRGRASLPAGQVSRLDRRPPRDIGTPAPLPARRRGPPRRSPRRSGRGRTPARPTLAGRTRSGRGRPDRSGPGQLPGTSGPPRR